MNELVIYSFLEVCLPSVEFLCGILSFSFNIVFGPQFWRLKHFHENLRKSILLLNFIVSFSPILHPIAVYLSQNDSPIAHGQYKRAFCLYTAHAVHHISLLFLHTKFFMLIFERVLAYRQRRIYEYSRNSLVFQIFVMTFLLCLCEISLKLGVFYVVDKQSGIDVLLLRTFTIDGSTGYYLFTYILAIGSGIAGYVCFYILLHRAMNQRHHCRTLSERFELRQTEIITHIMLPLCSVYLVAVLSCLVAAFVSIKLTFWGHDQRWIQVYRICVLYTHCVIGIYNLVATVYTMKQMKEMSGAKRAKVGDVIFADNETEKYFTQLEKQWQ